MDRQTIKFIQVTGDSMSPLIANGDWLFLGEKGSTYFSCRRGDIAFFINPKDNKTPMLKRIIGLPGERVKLQHGKVFIQRDRWDFVLEEPYIRTELNEFSPEKDFVFNIDSSRYLVLGDNRLGSIDSRQLELIPAAFIKGTIIGKVSPNKEAYKDVIVFDRYQYIEEEGILKAVKEKVEFLLSTRQNISSPYFIGSYS